MDNGRAWTGPLRRISEGARLRFESSENVPKESLGWMLKPKLEEDMGRNCARVFQVVWWKQKLSLRTWHEMRGE